MLQVGIMMKKNERVSAAQAAAELNMGVYTLRTLMKYNKINLGYAYKDDRSSKWSFIVYRSLLEEEKKRLRIGGTDEDR